MPRISYVVPPPPTSTIAGRTINPIAAKKLANTIVQHVHSPRRISIELVITPQARRVPSKESYREGVVVRP
ncbi:MAG: hypothetical protein ABIQ10_08150 [Gemmatimonadaceae bacterium]